MNTGSQKHEELKHDKFKKILIAPNPDHKLITNPIGTQEYIYSPRNTPYHVVRIVSAKTDSTTVRIICERICKKVPFHARNLIHILNFETS